jgi:FkbM family methyltransferase
MRKIIRNTLRSVGYDIVRWNRANIFPFITRFQSLGIDLVLDVGANVGQYAKLLRTAGYSGRIVSFEPVPTAFADLQRAAANDPNWEVACLALGSDRGDKKMNVGATSQMSSFRTIRNEYVAHHDWGKMAGAQSISIVRLDEVFASYARSQDHVLLKMDVQGYEDEVLKGASGILDRITAIQSELAIVPSYSEQKDWIAMIEIFKRLGFSLVDLTKGCHDYQDRLIEVDGWFVRT